MGCLTFRNGGHLGIIFTFGTRLYILKSLIMINYMIKRQTLA